MKPAILFFFIGLISLNAQVLNEQQLDSLYNYFLKTRGITVEEIDKPGEETEKNKCGFITIHQIKANLERFSLEKQNILKNLLQRPEKETSTISPSGFFRIHYDTTGFEVPRYDSRLSIEENVELIGIALDSSYNFEVNFLGYPPPPSDNGAGGDDKYDVYILNMVDYGWTSTEAFLGNQKYTSYMALENDYVGFPTRGVQGLQVTAAHEFHHAIQVGNYTADKLDSDRYFYEITSTAMEEFVYDSINDYYFYMPTYFNNTSVPFINTRGYELAIWNIFLRDKFGYDILKKQWQLLPLNSALNAINTSLNENGSNFKDALHEFGVWIFFTKHKAKPGEYFKEASEYPIAKSITTMFFQSPDEEIIVNSRPIVNSYVTFVNRSSTPDDSLTILVTNGDFKSGIENPNGNFSFKYTLFDNFSPGSTRLNENFNYYFKLGSGTNEDWSHSEFLNNELISEYESFAEYDYAFPSPFVYDKNSSIFMPFDNPETDNVDLNVYTPSMDLIYSKNEKIIKYRDQTGIRWNNPLDNDNRKLASGVYIYAIRSGNKTSLGKLVIFNE